MNTPPSPANQGQSLGGASFTLAVDAGGFVDSLDRAEKQARSTSNVIDRELTQGAKKAGMGLLYLGQAADDLQYGFKAIVNNIPQIVMGIGGSAGLAGAAAIAAVAVNNLINHWDDLQDALSSSKGIDAAKSNLDSLAEWLNKNLPLSGLGSAVNMLVEGPRTAADKRAALAADAQRAKAGAEAVKGAKSKEETDQADLFKKTLGAYGGDRLMNDLLSQKIAGRKLTPDQIEAVKQDVYRDIERGSSGKLGAKAYTGMYGQAFTDEYEKQLHKSQEGKRKREAARIDKMTEDAIRDEKEQFEEDKRARAQRIEDKIESKQERLDYLRDNKPEKSKIFSGTHEFSSHMLTGSLDSLAKAQLNEQKAIASEIKGLRKDLAKTREMRFE